VSCIPWVSRHLGYETLELIAHESFAFTSRRFLGKGLLLNFFGTVTRCTHSGNTFAGLMDMYWMKECPRTCRRNLDGRQRA
jgi:hypothetical protein